MPSKRNLFHYESGEGSGEGGTGEGGGSGSGSGESGSQGDGAGASGSSDEPSAEVVALRKEAAKYRTERNKLQTKVDELEGASKSEKEKLADDLAKARERVTAQEAKTRKLQVQVLAGEVGISKDAREDAASLLDWSRISDPDDDAEVLEALKDLVKEKKYLLGKTPGGSDGGEGGTRTDESADMNARIRQAAGRA